MAAGLAQEELKRIGRGLVGNRRRRTNGCYDFDLVVGDFDPALLELAVEGVDVVGVEIVELDHVEHLAGADRARVLGDVEKVPNLLALQESFDIDRHIFSTRGPRPSCGPASRPLWKQT